MFLNDWAFAFAVFSTQNSLTSDLTTTSLSKTFFQIALQWAPETSALHTPILNTTAYPQLEYAPF